MRKVISSCLNCERRGCNWSLHVIGSVGHLGCKEEGRSFQIREPMTIMSEFGPKTRISLVFTQNSEMVIGGKSSQRPVTNHNPCE